jgi:hypothetical protein
MDVFTVRTGPLAFELMFPDGDLQMQLVRGVPDYVVLEPFWVSESVTPFAGEGFLVAYQVVHPDFDQLAIDEEADKFGFGYLSGSYDFLKDGERESGYNVRSPVFGIHAPAWGVVLLFAVLPARRLIVRRCQGTPRLNKCIACGYSLTGNTSGVCPECGTAIAGKVGA